MVATFLLIPLFLIVPVLASLLSQKQDVELAARYAAWERTVWNTSAPPGPGGSGTVKSDAQVAREIDARIFALDTRALVSADDPGAALDAFSHRATTGESLLKDAGGGAHAKQTSDESSPGGLVGLTDDFFGALGSLTRFKLNRRGMYEATVSVDIVDLSSLFDIAGMRVDNLSLSRTSALFAEAWTGGNKANVEYLISGLLPQQYFDNAFIRSVQTFGSNVPFGEEVGPDYLDFGHADIDPLPAYRIGSQVPR